jgi:putative spermidine/putrescine transport system permease protein
MIRFSALPFLLATIFALLYSFGIIGFSAEGPGLQYWSAAVSDWHFYQSIVFSVSIAGLSTLLSFIFALFLNRKINFLLYFPLVLPPIVIGFIFFYLLGNSGLFSRIAYALGWIKDLNEFPWLIHDPFGVGIVIALTFSMTPFFALYLSHIYKNENIEKMEAIAESLGATKTSIFNQITIPILLLKSKNILFLYFIFALGSYEIPLLLGSSHPQMITPFILEKITRFNLNDIPVGYAMTVMIMLIIGGGFLLRPKP